MRLAGLLVLALIVANPLKAGDLALCLENQVKLDKDTVQAFRTELERILAISHLTASDTDCGAGLVTIVFRGEAPEEEPSALGRIRVTNGRMGSEIELFVSPTAQLIGTRLPAILGRALGRVATHELGHWLSRQATHSAGGIMMERLTAAHLMASDRNYFRLPVN